MNNNVKIEAFLPDCRAILSLLVILIVRFFIIQDKVSAQPASQIFNSSGSFTVPSGVYCITVEAWGGGGAGGGARDNGVHCGGGGGGGAYNKAVLNVTPGNTYNLIVGLGGTGGTGNGGAGGSSSFDGSVIARGGSGGELSSAYSNPYGGDGGQGGTGGVYAGGNGGNGSSSSSYSGGGGGGAGDAGNGENASGRTAGPGGDNNNGGTLGGDGGPGYNNSSYGNGNPGNVVGGGGGGGKKSSFGSDRNGGDGAKGQVVIAWTACSSFTAGITAEYCARPGYVRLTAHGGDAGSTYLWSNGMTTNPVDVNIAGLYNVTITNPNCCVATASYNISNELTVNGDFSDGHSGFSHSSYIYKADVSGNTELNPEGTFGIGSDPQRYHSNFWGRDHTTGSGNFLIVNGFPGSPQPVVWSETVNVLPGTTYYFSAWAISLNSAGNYATLQFRVNNTLVGTTAALPPRASNNTPPFNWIQFYGTWTAPAGVTSVPIEIIDLQTAATGNDFGLDDLSFATLTPIPVVISLPEKIKVCPGGTVNLTPVVTGGKAPYGYSWSGPNGFGSSNKDVVITGFDNSGSGTYQLSVTDGYGCPAVTASVNISLKYPPSFNNPPEDITVQCNAVPSPPTLTATDDNGPVGVTFQEVTTNGNCPGNYRIRRTWTAANDCGSVTHVQNITVTDSEKPFWLSIPLNQYSFCVQDIVNASWDLQHEPPMGAPPEYRVLSASEKNAFRLEPSMFFSDNCTPPENIILHWSLTSLLTGSYVTDEEGHLLDDETDAIANHEIKLDGGITKDAYYHIKYWLEDSCGNISDQQPTIEIIVNPRPTIINKF